MEESAKPTTSSRSESRKKKENADPGPGRLFIPYVLMEELFDKFKLLNYDIEFYREIRMKPISRHFFALPTNPGEQFYMFITLAAWLIRKTGKKFDTPQEFDDPNSVIANILDVLKQANVVFDFPPSKLKPGCGEYVILVLDRLAELALRNVNFSWKQPAYKHVQNDNEEEPIAADNAEFVSENVEEMIEEDFDVALDNEEAEEEENESDMLDLEGLRNFPAARVRNDKVSFHKPEGIMESSVDASEWKLEVERVLPQLKVMIKSETKDWRNHLDQIHEHRKEIEESLNATKSQLDKLYSDISHSLDKISSREKYLNNQLEQFVLEYRTAQSHLGQVKEQYNAVSGGVTERSRILSQLTEELEQVKQEMEERGSNMTDGKPLVNIRKAISKLRTELSQMDVHIGVAAHTLLQARLKEKGKMQKSFDNQTAIKGINVF